MFGFGLIEKNGAVQRPEKSIQFYFPYLEVKIKFNMDLVQL